MSDPTHASAFHLESLEDRRLMSASLFSGLKVSPTTQASNPTDVVNKAAARNLSAVTQYENFTDQLNKRATESALKVSATLGAGGTLTIIGTQFANDIRLE